MASEIIEINKRSYSTLFMSILQQSTPSSAFLPYNLSGTTGTFAFSQTLGGTPAITKVSTNSSQMLYTNSASGELEVYILDTDTAPLDPGTYYFTLYLDDATGKQWAAVTDKIRLKDTVKEA